jgi:hypothetical protein
MLQTVQDWLSFILVLIPVLSGVCSFLAAVLPQSDSLWRKVLDKLGNNWGNATNSVKELQKVVDQVEQAKENWQSKIRR